MEVKINDIIGYMERLAPPELSESWDNTGLLIGDRNGAAGNILLSLDFTDDSIDEAKALGAGLIITHHPAFLEGRKKINTDDPTGRKIIRAIQNNISVYSAHTNLDWAGGGVNDTLFSLLGLKKPGPLLPCGGDSAFSMGKTGELPEEMKLADFARHIKGKLNTDLIRYVGEGDKIIKKAAMCAGSASAMEFFKKAAQENCDVYLTGDIKYHHALDALDMGLCLVDITHFASEIIVLEPVKSYLEGEFLKDKININIYISRKGRQPFCGL